MLALRSAGSGSANATEKRWRDCRVFRVRFCRTPLVTSKGLYELQIPWAVGRKTICPRFPANEWSLRLGRCGVPLLLLIAFGYASVYIVCACSGCDLRKEPGKCMAVQSAWLSRIGAGILLIFAVVAALCAAIWLPYFLRVG